MFNTLVTDYETYYDQDYSLTKMGTEEYILSPLFQAHGCAVKFNDEPSRFLTHSETKAYFATLDWSKIILVGHKLMFDGAITAWRYGRLPILFADTLGLANIFIRPHTGRVKLDICAGYLNLPLKTNILNQVKGLSTNQIVSSGLWPDFARYATQDAENAHYLWTKYYPQINNVQKMILSWTTMNYVRGRMRIDLPLLEDAIIHIDAERDNLFREAGLDPALLRSVKKFEEYLKQLGIEIEYKNGKNGEIPAIGKDDPFVRNLLVHSDPHIRAVIKARLAASSNGEASRAKRLLKMARVTNGKMLVPMEHSAAHTGRPGGTDGVNPTNFKHGSPLRAAIVAPPGKILVDTDASQGEARVCAWLANCRPMLEAFADPQRDLYCEYASEVLYGKPVDKTMAERQVAKVEVLALQYGVGGRTLYNRCLAKGVAISQQEAYAHVNLYRSTYPEILGNGEEFCLFLREVVKNPKLEIQWKGCVITIDGIQLPSKRWIYYPQLTVLHGDIVYYSARYKSWQKLYPGAINENLCQSIVNDLVGIVLAQFYHDTVFWTYDSVVRLVDVERKDEAAAETLAAMTTLPVWATSLPLAAEAKFKEHL